LGGTGGLVDGLTAPGDPTSRVTFSSALKVLVSFEKLGEIGEMLLSLCNLLLRASGKLVFTPGRGLVTGLSV
jgi:hypothetical protein